MVKIKCETVVIIYEYKHARPKRVRFILYPFTEVDRKGLILIRRKCLGNSGEALGEEKMDPGTGFEPVLMESESIVLPLNYPGSGGRCERLLDLMSPYIMIFFPRSSNNFRFRGNNFCCFFYEGWIRHII